MSAADLLAIFRAIAVIPVAWLITIGARDIALVGFALAAVSDAVDGWLARRAGTLGPRGAFLDPIADKILVVGTLIALSAAGTGWPVTVVTIFVAAREALVTAIRVRALSRNVGLPAEGIAKVKTALEMIGVALIILDGRPWAVLGAGIVGVAFLIGLATLPRYLATRLA